MKTLHDSDLIPTETRQDTYVRDMKENTNTRTNPQVERAAHDEINGELSDPLKK